MRRFLVSVSLVVLIGVASVCVAAEPPIEKQPAPKEEQSASLQLTRLGTTGFWHGGIAHSISYSGDGKLLASANGMEVRLWDPEAYKELRRLTGHTHVVNAVALSPDGRRAATIGFDKTARIWDTGTGKELFRMEASSNFSYAVAFSPDGKTVACGEDTGTIDLWDPTTGKVLRRINEAGWGASSISFSPDGKEFASGDERGAVRRWETATAKKINEFTACDQHVSCNCYSPDGKMLATGSSRGMVSTWSIATGKEIRRVDVDGWVVASVAFTANMKEVAVGGIGGVGLQMINLESGKTRRCDLVALGVPKEKEGISGLALAPGGKTLAVATGGDTLLLLDPVSLKPEARYHLGPVSCLSFSPDGKTLAWGGPDSGTLRIAEVANGKDLLCIKEAAAGFRSIARSPDGKQLAAVTNQAGRKNPIVRRWDATTGKPIEEFNKQEHAANAVAFSADGKYLQGLCPDGSACLWEVAGGKEVKHAECLEQAQWDDLLSPDGTRLARREGVAQITVYRLPDLQVLSRIKGEFRYGSMAFSADGRTLARADVSKRMCFWSTATGDPIADWEISDHVLGGRASAFSPDGRTLALVFNKSPCDVRLFEVSTHKLRATLRGHIRPVVALAFSSDGRLLASGSADQTCVIWDLTGRRVAGLADTERLAGKDIGALWVQLKDDKAGPAWRAFWALAAGSDAAVAFLQDRLTPAPKVDNRKIKQWIVDLDSDQFAQRDAASTELARAGAVAEPALRKTLEARPSLELRHRIDELLEKLGPVPKGERLGDLRAVEVLEQIGTEQARKLLNKLAGGAKEDVLTQEAKASLERLAARKQQKWPD